MENGDGVGQDWELSSKSKNEREHERILKEIETTDTAFVGASLRAIYEGSYHESFLSRLDLRVKQHDRDIERLCNFHYNGFIESITELIQVRGDAEGLKNQVVAVNGDQQESGKFLSRKSEDLIQCRLQQRNIASVIEEMTSCLPILQTYGKMQDQLKAGRHYSALKTLEKLENNYLTAIHSYRFCEIMRDNIPKIRSNIKEISTSQLKNFLEEVRTKSSTVGKLAMKQAADMKYAVPVDSFPGERPELNRSWKESVTHGVNGSDSLATIDEIFDDQNHDEIRPTETAEDPFDPEEKKLRHGKKVLSPPSAMLENHGGSEKLASGSCDAVPVIPPRRKKQKRRSGEGSASTMKKKTIVIPEESNNELLNDALWRLESDSGGGNPDKLSQQDVSLSELIDFSPVYKCIHIHGILKCQKEFKTYYCTQRKTQALIACQPPSSMGENLENYMNFLNQIAGFFIIEDYILHTANDLVDQMYITNLWNTAVTDTIAALRRDLEFCYSADTLLSVKNLIVVFADTLRAYGFSVDSLFSFLMELRDQFGETLLKKWGQILFKIFDEDNYTPMEVSSEAEAVAMRKSIPLEEMGITTTYSYPLQLPFSKFVPCVYGEIKAFTHSCLQYCRDLHLSSTEIDDGIRKQMNLLLTRTLNTELHKLVQKPSLGLTELVQITINISYLEDLCKHVEKYICQITGINASASHSMKLIGLSTFKDARSETEAKIYAKVDSKIDDFFELAEYDWGLLEPQGTASSYLKDLIAFLKHNFKVFSHLPEKVSQTACMSACKHIGAKLMETLLDPDIRQITMAAIHQYNLDVMQCEQFADSEPVPGFEENALQMSFLDIRQLLELFISWDWSSYLADYGTENGKYVRVPASRALMLLEKIKEDSRKWNILSSFNRQEREKKKLLDTVIKQLRSIINGESSSMRMN